MATTIDDRRPGDVRALDQHDLPACLDLAVDRRWPAEEAKWRFLLSVGAAFGIDDQRGGLSAAVIVTGYPPGLAVIGMLVVASRHGRRGLGRLLMEHALTHSASSVVYLHATPLGRPLYEHLGFQDVDTVVKHVGVYRAVPVGAGPRVRTLLPADRAEILRLDRVVFGADRTAVLTALGSFAQRLVIAEDGGCLVGYAAAWRNLDVLIIGPVVASDDVTAQALVQTLAAHEPGPVRIDVPSRCAGLSPWCQERGLLPDAVAPLMVHHGHPLPGERGRLYALTMQALG